MAAYLTEFAGVPRPGEYPITHRFRSGIDDRRFLFLEARQALFIAGELLKELTQALWDLHRETTDRPATGHFNAGALRRRLRAEAAHGDDLTQLCLTVLELRDDEVVVYATWETGEQTSRLTITRAPIDVSDVLTNLYAASQSVVATSATLSVMGSFDFMRERLAAPDFMAVELDATFDYESQAGLILTRHLPPPRADREAEFVQASAETAVASIGTARGGTLGLFTSRRRMTDAFRIAEPGVHDQGLDLRAQIPGMSTRELADWFRDQRDSSLFGLRSFWEGFDAPGDTLRLLLIERLPFPSPADPMIAARSERMELQQRDPFFEFAVPMAALVFKQGFGRLIRSRQDRGAVVVLDRRLRTGLTYQGEFLASLPSGLPIHYPVDELDYLETLAETLGVAPRPDLATGVGPKRGVVDLGLTTVIDPGNDVELDNALRQVLAMFGLSAFRPGQEELIRAVVADNRDVVGLLPTGAGKSLVYQAASMCLDGVGLVVSPLIALMKDQVDSLRNDFGFPWAFAIHGGQTAAERDEILDAVRQGGCRLLYISPERLRDANLLNALKYASMAYRPRQGLHSRQPPRPRFWTTYANSFAFEIQESSDTRSIDRICIFQSCDAVIKRRSALIY
jgi:ATP-dependent DNA helicase RecQ